MLKKLTQNVLLSFVNILKIEKDQNHFFFDTSQNIQI